MNDLDSAASYAIDVSGMFAHIERLGTELEAAWAEHGHSPMGDARPATLTLAGMGGSASAADYFAALVERAATIPVNVVREYQLPGHVGPGALVAVVSYSGTTEEAISCYEQARARGADTFAVTSGGQLAELARRQAQPACIITYAAPPRAALAHMLAPLLALAPIAGAPAFDAEQVRAGAQCHRDLVRGTLGREIAIGVNPAKTAAADISPGAVPVIFAAEHLVAAGQRGKNQFAENAKTLAVFEAIPEGTHNTVVSLEATAGPRQVGLAFDSPLLGAGNRRRVEITARLFKESGFPFHVFRCSGASLLADLMEATAYVDFISCYLATLRGIDPTPTGNLTRVRSETATASRRATVTTA